MYVNLAIGVCTLLVALGTFGFQFVPRPPREPGEPERPSVVRGPFGVFVLGVVPLLASVLFLGAAWMDSGSTPAPPAASGGRGGS
jgi:hypothetical protein